MQTPSVQVTPRMVHPWVRAESNRVIRAWAAMAVVTFIGQVVLFVLIVTKF